MSFLLDNPSLSSLSLTGALVISGVCWQCRSNLGTSSCTLQAFQRSSTKSPDSLANTPSKIRFRVPKASSELALGWETMICPKLFTNLSSDGRRIPGTRIANIQNRRRARRSRIGVKGTGCATFRRGSGTSGKTYVAGAKVYFANRCAFGCHDVARLRRRRKEETKIGGFHEPPVTICVFSV
jgi:hypothetical protein